MGLLVGLPPTSRRRAGGKCFQATLHVSYSQHTPWSCKEQSSMPEDINAREAEHQEGKGLAPGQH